MLRRFWWVHFCLLLLYLWTLTEEATIDIQLENDFCTAVIGERHSTIPCSGLEDGYVGLLVNGRTDPYTLSPLDHLLAPGTGWREIQISTDGEIWQRLKFVGDSPGWHRIAGEWRAEEEAAVLQFALPQSDHLTIRGILRRPAEEVGILLLDSDKKNGWVLLASGKLRKSTWWEWQDGQIASPLTGIPFARTFISQTQALLRQVLQAHQGALLLLLAGWLLTKIASWLNIPLSLRGKVGLRVRLLNFARQQFVPLVALCVLLFTTFIAAVILERMPHVQDSVTYLFQSQTLARGQLSAPAPPQPDSFEQEFVLVRDGRWFGKYPPGFPLLLVPGVWLNLPWLINPILAALTIPLLYALSKELYGRSVGRLAIGLTAVSPFFLFLSGSMMAHAAELFWVTLFMLAWLRTLKRPSYGWPVLAGVALGMTFLTRQLTAVVIGSVFVLMTSLPYLRLGNWRMLVRKTAVFALTVLPFLMVLLAYQAILTGDPLQDPRLLYWPWDGYGFGSDIGERPNAFHAIISPEGLVTNWFYDETQMPRGHSPARGLYNTQRNWQALQNHLFGWLPMFTMSFVALAFLAKRPNWADTTLLITFAGVVTVYVAYWASGIMYGPRYYYAALPALVLLSARGIQALGQQIGRRSALFLVMAFITGNLIFYMPHQFEVHREFNFITQPDMTKIAEEIEEPAIIFVPAAEGKWWEYGRFFSYNTPWLDGDVIFARDLGSEANGRLLADFPSHQAYLWHNDELVRYSPRRSITSN